MKSRQLLITAIVLGLVSVGVILFLVTRGVLTPQNIISSLAIGDQYGSPKTHFACADLGQNGEIVKLNDNDPRVVYSKEWAYQKGGAGSQICYQEDYHFAPDFVTQKLEATKNYHASMEFSFNGNQVGIRFIEGGNRGAADILIDGVKVDQYNLHTDGGIYGRPAWLSPDLACGEHTIRVEQVDGGTSTSGKVIVIDYLQYRECVPAKTFVCARVSGEGADTGGCSATNDGQSCGVETAAVTRTANQEASVSQESQATQDGFLICGANNTCQLSQTATENDPTCSGLGIGDICKVEAKELECQGNSSAPAKCFDCKRDAEANSSASEINILDFSCFAKYYGKEVGKD